MISICVNGKILPADEPALSAANRGYRYGDGLFETMKLVEEKLVLGAFHFERLFAGLELLKYTIPPTFTPAKLEKEILHLCKRNECEKLARIRLSVSRGHGGLYEEPGELQYIIEASPLPASANELNTGGLVIGIYPSARKSCDEFSNLKSANFLPYVQAALHAKENGWNDCLVLNSFDRIADATTANVFMIKNGVIYTPPLSEGCVAGVMRRFLLEKIQDAGYRIQEDAIHVEDLNNADEIFLTNAVQGIRWVRQCGHKKYISRLTQVLTGRFSFDFSMNN